MKLLTVAEVFPLMEHANMEVDDEGWNSDHELFGELINKVYPKTIIEVGSWKGRSTMHMAYLTKDMGGVKIYCVDTWLGDPNPDSNHCLSYDVGAVFRQFCFNITKRGYADRVYPIPQTSSGAAKLLWREGVRGALIYLDADHSYEGTYADLENYVPLVLDGGYIFGDDWTHCAGVRMAVTRFAFENNLKIRLSGPAWVLEAKS